MDNEKDPNNSLANHLPSDLAFATISACLGNFPLALIGISTLYGLSKAHISIVNENKIYSLLDKLKSKVEEIDDSQKLFECQPYQEVARKKLLEINCFTTDQDLDILAQLAMMATSLGDSDPLSTRLLEILITITTRDVRILFLIKKYRTYIEEDLKNASDLEKGDAAAKENIVKKSDLKFATELSKLTASQNDMTPLLPMYNLGLINNPNTMAWGGGPTTNKVKVPFLTILGKRFIDTYQKTSR